MPRPALAQLAVSAAMLGRRATSASVHLACGNAAVNAADARRHLSTPAPPPPPQQQQAGAAVELRFDDPRAVYKQAKMSDLIRAYVSPCFFFRRLCARCKGVWRTRATGRIAPSECPAADFLINDPTTPTTQLTTTT